MTLQEWSTTKSYYYKFILNQYIRPTIIICDNKMLAFDVINVNLPLY